MRFKLRLDQEAIKKFIPHREPFLFLDSIDSIELSNWKYGTKVNDPKDALGGLVTGKFFVDENLDMFKGHFPDKPIFPGVIQVEAMAQCSSFVMSFFIDQPIDQYQVDVALARVEDCRFRKPVLPNTDLTIRAKVVKYRNPIIITQCDIHCGDELVSEAKISASIKL
ncbi:MAG: hypothetical protein CME61_01270 [Halobacteriovoraceae bacterium]|nr:hypothetical protein [Halobacteriovoraceae bacterium]